MATKTISLAEDAYERLAAEKREGESFSDVVRRLTAGVDLADYYGTLSPESGEELADVVERERTRRDEEHRERAERVRDAFDP